MFVIASLSRVQTDAAEQNKVLKGAIYPGHSRDGSQLYVICDIRCED